MDSGDLACGKLDQKSKQVVRAGALVLGLGIGFMVQGIKLINGGWLIAAIGLLGTLLLLTNPVVPAMFLLLSTFNPSRHTFDTANFSGPSDIHGADMPGLAELRSAKASAIAIEYRGTDHPS